MLETRKNLFFHCVLRFFFDAHIFFSDLRKNVNFIICDYFKKAPRPLMSFWSRKWLSFLMMLQSGRVVAIFCPDNASFNRTDFMDVVSLTKYAKGQSRPFFDIFKVVET